VLTTSEAEAEVKVELCTVSAKYISFQCTILFLLLAGDMEKHQAFSHGRHFITQIQISVYMKFIPGKHFIT
jgi:hypothetical protein